MIANAGVSVAPSPRRLAIWPPSSGCCAPTCSAWSPPSSPSSRRCASAGQGGWWASRRWRASAACPGRRLQRLEGGGDRLPGKACASSCMAAGYGRHHRAGLHRHADDGGQRLPMPFMLPADEGARRFAGAIEAGTGCHGDPLADGVVAKLLRLLPNPLFDRIAARAGRKPSGSIEPKPDIYGASASELGDRRQVLLCPAPRPPAVGPGCCTLRPARRPASSFRASFQPFSARQGCRAGSRVEGVGGGAGHAPGMLATQ